MCEILVGLPEVNVLGVDEVDLFLEIHVDAGGPGQGAAAAECSPS